jgi:hypothetical protein
MFGCKFLFETHTLLEQCTYLGYLLLEAPRKYVQHGPPSEHQLTPALSPIWDPHPKPSCPEEVVYSPNDSCSHFTQRLFPPNFLSTIHVLFFIIHSCLLYITFKQAITSLYIHDKSTLSFLRLFIAGRLPSISRVRYTANA